MTHPGAYLHLLGVHSPCRFLQNFAGLLSWKCQETMLCPLGIAGWRGYLVANGFCWCANSGNLNSCRQPICYCNSCPIQAFVECYEVSHPAFNDLLKTGTQHDRIWSSADSARFPSSVTWRDSCRNFTTTLKEKTDRTCLPLELFDCAGDIYETFCFADEWTFGSGSLLPTPWSTFHRKMRPWSTWQWLGSSWGAWL